VGVGKACPSPAKIGDSVQCVLSVSNRDGFGDDLIVVGIWDVIDPDGPLEFRNPPSGYLPIVEVSAGVECAADPTQPIGLTFPCVIPGVAVPNGSGQYVEVISEFVVPEGAEACPRSPP
jgi:hypothetical protein